MLAPDLLTTVDEIFASYHRERESPDVTYGIVHDGAVVHSGGLRSDPDAAELGPDSIFRIASMTKSFTAAAVLHLRDRGQLTLDEPVAIYVPEVATLDPVTTDAPPLTLRLLLTMSAGLPNDDPWADRQESLSPDELSALLSDGIRFSSVPGTTFEYSNLGYAIIGRAITNVTGESYRDVVRSRLIDPLGLTSTRFSAVDVDNDRLVVGHRRFGDGWEPLPYDGPGEFSSIGGLYSSVRDLARWVGWFTAAHGSRAAIASTAATADGDDAVLSTTSRREMQQMYRLSGATVVDDGAVRSTGYGFGLNVVNDSRWGDFVSHSGGYPGYGSHMRWHPASGYGVIALGNVMYAATRRPATEALDAIVAAVGATPKSVRVWPETIARHLDVHRLLLAWDDEQADAVFSPNIDLDLPRERRRAAIDEVLGALGTIDPVPGDVRSLQSGAEVTWTVVGSAGRATVAIWLTPERNPRVHTLTVTAVADVVAPAPVAVAVDTDDDLADVTPDGEVPGA